MITRLNKLAKYGRIWITSNGSENWRMHYDISLNSGGTLDLKSDYQTDIVKALDNLNDLILEHDLKVGEEPL